MAHHQLDSALKCSECGTVRMNIPLDDYDDMAVVTCSTCGKPMGEIKDDFARQAGNGVFLLDEGQFKNQPRRVGNRAHYHALKVVAV